MLFFYEFLAMEKARLYYLFDRYTAGTITPSEELEFAGMVVDPANEATLKELESHYWEKLKDTTDLLPGKAEQSLREILPAPVVSLRKKIGRMVAAASILLIIGTGAFFFFFNRKGAPPEATAKAPVHHDIQAPETNRATITLANGQTVYLDSVANGSLAMQGSVNVVKLADGKIAYTGSASEIVYNELSNPRGSKVIDMTLSDGSHVWLNAGSSIRFPVAFAGNERKVSVTGEAYFEVAHNAAMPFKVIKDDMEITVLGTHFNVNTYDDEANMKITLLEGAVKINKGSATGFLKPGQQAQVAGVINVKDNVDIDAVMAWKNGQFVLDGTDIKTLMRQVCRWYDVEVEYSGMVPEREFDGSIDRDVPLKRVIQALQGNGVKCRLEGRKVIIGN